MSADTAPPEAPQLIVAIVITERGKQRAFFLEVVEGRGEQTAEGRIG